MKKPYQIEAQRAIKQLDAMAADGNRAVLVGERSHRQAERTASQWSNERGYCVVMGQKAPIQRPRVRTTDDKEVRLGSYEMFHRGEPHTR